MLYCFDHDFSLFLYIKKKTENVLLFFFWFILIMFANAPHKINGQKLYFFETQLLSEKNDTLHLKIAHSVRIVQSNKQNM